MEFIEGLMITDFVMQNCHHGWITVLWYKAGTGGNN